MRRTVLDNMFEHIVRADVTVNSEPPILEGEGIPHLIIADLIPLGAGGIEFFQIRFKPIGVDNALAERPKPAHNMPTHIIAVDNAPKVEFPAIHHIEHAAWIDQREIS